MEKTYNAKAGSGYGHAALSLIALAAIIAGLVNRQVWMLALLAPWLLHLFGFMILAPNRAGVLVLFGAYKGTIKNYGFFWINPFMLKKQISLRAYNLDSKPIKVNDKLGNPIMIGAVLVWRVKDTYKAFFDVENYADFVNIQTDAAIRKLAGAYPYDSFDDHESDICLRSSLEEVNAELEREMSERLALAGIEVIEARISNLAYAQEIAGAMLQRQQATAIIAARRKIVEGAVGMVEMALEELSKKGVVELDDARKASMVSNLMVVLCSDKAASPVVNTGTLYQ
jgi:regulator of protease activity HflC (stomatin/prohibitin superfamily)